MDLAALLMPVAPDAPAGPDLSYDPGRQAIEQAFEGPADEADWDGTIAMIEAQARQTRDVWLAIYLMRAGARAGDLAVVETGAGLLAGLFEGFWDTAHPTLEEYGVEGRKGACESLVRIGEFLAPLRRVPLVVHPRLGSFTGGDFTRYLDEGAAADGYGQFRAALADTPVEQVAEVTDRFRRIEAALQRADAILSEQAGLVGQTGTNFRPTYDAIESIVDAITPFVRQDAEPVTVATSEATTPSAAVGAGVSVPGRIQSREDVARSLDAVIEYYGRVEPSSPIPVALARVKGWITMDFVSILEDIAPGSVGEATSVLRARVDAAGSSDMM